MALPEPSKTTVVRPKTQRAWWKESVVYQIYPSSFKSSIPTSGHGDIRGIISELDYIKGLGVDIVWLSPILASPQVDMGYDISDYKDIDPRYGTMAEHDALIKGLHDRKLKYVMDLVVNHTSDQHEWFKQSRGSKNNPYRKWYIWKPAKGVDDKGKRIPPNNWRSAFSGSAWEWDEVTQEYYLHLFAKEQPDLNWEEEEVIEAVHDIIRFWLKRGVDGFRMDVINFISKVPGLPDAEVTVPGTELQSGSKYFACGPRLHELFQGIGKIMKEYDAFSVGEMPGVYDAAEVLKAVGGDRGELQMSFNFEMGEPDLSSSFSNCESFMLANPDITASVDLDNGDGDKFKRRDFQLLSLKAIVNKWQTFMIENGGWNALYMENHDQSRTVTRYASAATPELRILSSKMLATHLALQSGTVFVYQGQELAQVNIPQSWGMEKYRDIECLNHWKEVLKNHPDDEQFQEDTRREYWLKSRDNARTPMQWDDSPNAGFCPEGVTPWMDVHEDFQEWNAAKQKGNEDSPYAYWGKVLGLRKGKKDVFVYGDFKMVDIEHTDVFAYTRTDVEGEGKALVVTSFAKNDVEWAVPKAEQQLFSKATVALKNYADGPNGGIEQGVFLLRPFEAFVLMAE